MASWNWKHRSVMWYEAYFDICNRLGVDHECVTYGIIAFAVLHYVARPKSWWRCSNPNPNHPTTLTKNWYLGLPNSETKVQCCDDRPMSSPSLVMLGARAPEKALSVVPHPPKIARQKRAKSSITQPWIIRFRSDFIQSLSA